MSSPRRTSRKGVEGGKILRVAGLVACCAGRLCSCTSPRAPDRLALFMTPPPASLHGHVAAMSLAACHSPARRLPPLGCHRRSFFSRSSTGQSDTGGTKDRLCFSRQPTSALNLTTRAEVYLATCGHRQRNSTLKNSAYILNKRFDTWMRALLERCLALVWLVRLGLEYRAANC